MKHDILIDEKIMQATCALLIDGKVRGTAWLINNDEGYLLTAGHLLGTENPHEKVEIQFKEDAPRIAYKVQWGYQKHMGIDFAVLKLSSPLVNRQPLPISLVHSVSGTFRLCGYGQTLKYQSMGRGEFVGYYDWQNSSSNRLLKLDSRQLGEGGYSGGAVVSDELQSVVAIQISATIQGTGAERDTLLAMPLYRIFDQYKPLHCIVKDLEVLNTSVENETSNCLHLDWEELPDTSTFFGRSEELKTLEDWITHDLCRVVAVVGMRGIGKTVLSARLAKGGIGKTDLVARLSTEIQGDFEFVIWKGLLNAPSLKDILSQVIKFLSMQKEIYVPEDTDSQIACLLHYLKSHRCLLILDNMESILQGEQDSVKYRSNYEDYGKLLQRIGETNHQSCLLLTSREQPPEISQLKGSNKSVRLLELKGLEEKDAIKLVKEIVKESGDLSGSGEAWKALIELYNGNPLALELAAFHIHDVFFGDIALFLCESKPVFSDLRELLDWHFKRLSEAEKEVMYWLSINREPISMIELKEDIVLPSSQHQLSSTLQLLQRRMPLERSIGCFTLQPVLIEYFTESIVERVVEDIKNHDFTFLNTYAVLKASAEDYVRESQACLILEPIIEKLCECFDTDRKNLVLHINQLLLKLREKSPIKPGYAAGNILNILCRLKADLTKYDFSDLTVRQAYLKDINLHYVNFSNADLTNSVFMQTCGNVLSVAFSRDGKILAASDVNAKIHLWQVMTGKKVLTLEGHSRWVGSIIFSPDSQTLASSSDDGTIRLWDISRLWDTGTPQCINILKGHVRWVRTIDFSPDGNLLVSGSDDQTIKLWDIKTDQNSEILQGGLGRIRTVAFSPDGKSIASGHEDQKIRIWDIKTNQCLKTFEGHSEWVYSVSFSPDGKNLVSGSGDNTVKIWNVDTGKCLKTLDEHTNWVWTVAFSSDGKTLASGSYDKTVRLWNVSTGQCLHTLQGHTNQLRSVAFSPDCKSLASGSDDQTVRLWKVKSGQCINVLQGYINWIWSIAFSLDGKNLASGGDDKIVRIWNIKEGNCSKDFDGHTYRIRQVCFSPDGKLLASGSDDRTIKLWNIDQGTCLLTLTEHTSWISSIAFSSDSQTLCTSSDDQTVRLWNVNTGQCFLSLKQHPSWISSISLSPDSRFMAVGYYDHTIRLWDVDRELCFLTLRGHAQSVSSVVFNPDGKTIISGSEDNTVRIWDANSGECIYILKGHTNRVKAVDCSSNGLLIVSGSFDTTIRIWDSREGKCLKVLKGHTNKVRSVVFSSNNQMVASSGEDETIKIWNVDTGECSNTLRPSRPYEGMNITNVDGLTKAQKISLRHLGSIEL